MASTRSFDPNPGGDFAASFPFQTPTEPALPAEWYVAEGDYEVGPLTLEDLEARWRNGDLSEQTLVWRMGMQAWQQAAEVDDLHYLIVDLPRDEIQIVTPTVNWQSADIASLAELAAFEHDVVEAKERPDEHSGLPAYLQDFESLGFQHTPQTQDPFAFSPSVAADAPPAWPSYSSPPEERAPVVRMRFVIAGFAALALALTNLALLWPDAAPQPVAPAALAEAPELEPVLKREATAEVTPAPEPVAVTPTPAPEAKQPATRKPSRRRASTRTSRSQPAAPRAAAANSGKVLSRDDILAGVRSNGRSLGPCIKAARSRGELLPGKHRFIVAWTVQPSGAVVRPRLKGPAAVLRTSMPACFESKMRNWRFPASSKPSKVRNFPMPVTVR